jgi:hypothetical protein
VSEGWGESADVRRVGLGEEVGPVGQVGQVGRIRGVSGGERPGRKREGDGREESDGFEGASEVNAEGGGG